MTRVRIEDPALLAELAQFLEAADYTPMTRTDSVLEIAHPHDADPATARRQLDLYLRTWRGMHPDAPAVIDY